MPSRRREVPGTGAGGLVRRVRRGSAVPAAWRPLASFAGSGCGFRKASVMSGATSSICHWRAPGSRSSSAMPSSLSLGRRTPGDAAEVVRRQQVLHRQVQLLGLGLQQRPGGGEPRGGLRVPVRPDARGRGSVGGQVQGREFLQGPGGADAAQPARRLALGGAAVEALGAQQLRHGGGHGLGGGDEGGIGDEPAGSDVALLRQGVAFQPQFPDCGQLAAVPDLVQPGGLAPRVNARRRLRRPRGWRRIPARRTPACRPPRGAR